MIATTAALLALVLAVPAPIEPTAPDRATTRILFLGNSYIGVNDLPQLLVDLASSGGRTVSVSRNTPGGNTLGAPQTSGAPHMTNAVSLAMIGSVQWDVVVLQEQSYLPTIPYTKNQYMKPGAASLDASIKANDPATRTMLFQTWGRKNGGQFCWGPYCSPNFGGFPAMQNSLTAAYDEVAAHIASEVAPVGEAFRVVRQLDPAVNLYRPDGSHPNLGGSYLAACVFYAAIFDQSPVGLSYDPGLPPGRAAFLQDCAARAVWQESCGFASYGTGVLPLQGYGDAALGGRVYLGVPQLPPTVPAAVVFACLQPATVPVPGGMLLLDPGTYTSQSCLVFAGQPWAIDVPVDPALTGADLYFQAVTYDPWQPGSYVLSNGLAFEVCP